MGDNHIERVTSFVHLDDLGHIINSDLNNKDDILHRCCTFIAQVNNVLCYIPRLDADVRYKLFWSYCSSIFECEHWNLNEPSINSFCTAWRTGLRRIWKVPNTTHTVLLHLLSDDLLIFEELCRRSFMFIHNCFFHNSSLVRFVTRYAVLAGQYGSVIGSNFRLCISRFGVDERAFCDGLVSVDCAVKQYHSRVIDQGPDFQNFLSFS